MENGSDEEANFIVCHRCKLTIPMSEMDLHRTQYCSWNLEKCKHCGSGVPKRRAGEPFLNTHALACKALRRRVLLTVAGVGMAVLLGSLRYQRTAKH